MLMILGENSKVNQILGQLRNKIIKQEFEKKIRFWFFLWVIDFPMFSWSEEEQRIMAEHHPFTMPNLEDFKKNLKISIL